MHRQSDTGAKAQAQSEPSSLSLLKRRLISLWDSQQFHRDPQIDEDASKMPYRGRAAAFIPLGSRILDVASGVSANADWLSPRGTYFGTDITLGFLRLAKRQNLNLICADAERLPFQDASFDAALLSFALEHSVNPVKILKEMCRVVRRPNGRVILLGPAWDFPFWYPNALRSKAQSPAWLCRYTISRFYGQFRGWLFGDFPFLIVENPDALTHPFEHDADAVYIVWAYEVIQQMKRLGCLLIHSEVDNRLLGARKAIRMLKRLALLMPIYRLAGSTVLMVFETSG